MVRAKCTPLTGGAIRVRFSKSGTIYALSYCNLGLWGNQTAIAVE